MQWYVKYQGTPALVAVKVIDKLDALRQSFTDSPELDKILLDQIQNVHSSTGQYDQHRGLAIKAAGRFDKVRKSGSSVVLFETVDLVL